jgi:glycerol-3-phosphate O-acyltransferase/dihydroxyacetone phosphate acyltransferase
LIRQIITAILRIALRVFFRRIEVAGIERVPLDKPVIFVLNHPNGLVDPVFMLCLVPRRVSFLAKAPLFRMPVIGFFVRALDSLPAYRQQDAGEDTSRNRETFEQAGRLLAKGGTIAICPEGVSHNEPRLKPLKTGAARIAISAMSADPSLDLKIIPVGLYYTSKMTFRSSALLYFGEPLDVAPATLEAEGEPPREAVRELRGRIEIALKDCIVNAEHDEALGTIERAERVFSSAEQLSGEPPSLVRELKLRQRFIEGYAVHRAQSPERLASLQARLDRFEEELKQAGFDLENLSPPSSRSAVVRRALVDTAIFAALLPTAILGAVVHYPAYRLAGYFATRLAHKDNDVVSTIKIVASMLFFPLTWILGGVICLLVNGWLTALLALLILPAMGYIAMLFFEELDRFVGAARALLYFITRRRFFVRLLAERRAIHDEILALGSEVREH